MNRALRAAILICVVFLCCSCAQTTTDPSIPYGLLIKSRDFLTFCIFLVDQEKPYYNHLAQRYYYALFSMALITYQWHQHKGIKYKVIDNHQAVWNLEKKDTKDAYGEKLKALRTRCDYHYDECSRNIELFGSRLKEIVCDGDKKAFSQLVCKTKEDYVKYFKRVAVDETITKSDCECLIKEIETLNNRLKNKLDAQGL